MGKKQRVKKLKLNIYDRRVVQIAVNSLLQSERNTGHDPQLMAKRMGVLAMIDSEEVDEHFEHINEAGIRGEKISKEDRYGESEEKYTFRQGMYYWIKERMEKTNYFGMFPDEVMESLGKWEIDYSDTDLWGNDEVDEVEEIEEEEATEEPGKESEEAPAEETL